MLSLSKMAEAQVPQDLVEPGKEFLLGVERVAMLVGPRERLLGELKGVFVTTHESQGHEIGLLHVAFHKGLECLLGVNRLRPLQSLDGS